MATKDLGHWPEDKVYIGPDCVTRYWIWNDEHNCIAYGKVDHSVLDTILKDKIKEKNKDK